MLDLQKLRQQFDGFTAYQAQEQALLRHKHRLALHTLSSCGPQWEDVKALVEDTKVSWLVAELRERPDLTYTCGPRPTPITLVATDGSQIYPDRHVEPTCYLLNVSRIAFHYGTLEQPLMEAVPQFRYRKQDLEDHFDDLIEQATTEVVSALRDEYELQALLETALECRKPHRPLVALADGTLIRWMLRRMQNHKLEAELIARYTHILRQFQEAEIPLASYISMPGNTEVVNLLRVVRGEHEQASLFEDIALEGLTDRRLFEAIIPLGERSAVFTSASRIQRAYGTANRICYFYIHVPVSAHESELGRIEIPEWVADQPHLLDRIHAVVLSECEKGNGYPMILSEAHERAVVRAKEKEVFYTMIREEMAQSGLPFIGSQKQASKRKPIV